MTSICALRNAFLAFALVGPATAQAADEVVQVHLGPPRLQEFVQAGRDDAVKDAKNALFRVYYCNTPGFHPPPELEQVAKAEKDMKVLLQRYGIHVAWPSSDPTSIEGTVYVCPYVQAYNCAMLEQIRLKYGVKVARRVHAFGLPCK
jgi:hypothetical protein